MANNIEIKITNIAEIRRAFNKAPVLMTKELNLAIGKVTKYVQAKSMINTPVRTTRLRSSTRSSFGNLRGEVGTHTNYDIFVHNGTRFMTAQPYLKDAVDESGAVIERNFKSAAQNALDAIARET